MRAYFSNKVFIRTAAIYLMATVFFAGVPLQSILAAPSVDIKANGSDGPVDVVNGDSWSFSWTSGEATACQMSTPSGASGVTLSGNDGPISPSHPWYPAVGSSVTLTLDCTDGVDSTTDSVTINIVAPADPPPPPGAVDADIKANGSDGPVTITNGDSWNFSWTSSGATACQLSSPSGVSGITLSGSDGPIAPSHPWYPAVGSSVTLTLDCTDGSINSTDSVTINIVAAAPPSPPSPPPPPPPPPPPGAVTADIKANGSDGPVTIANGELWNFTWTSTGATACQLTSPSGVSGITLSGSDGPIAPSHPWYPAVGGSTTLTLDCTNGTLNATDSVVILIVAAPPPPPPPPPGAVTADIKANGSDGPVIITQGDSWNFSWTSTGATACQLTSPSGVSGITLSGSDGPISPTHSWYPTLTASTTLTIDCTNGVTNATDSVVIGLVAPPPPPPPGAVTADIKINGSDTLVTIFNGESWNFTWTSSGATACQLTSPSGVTGITLAGSDGPINPGHPWYPAVGGITTLTLDCTNGTLNATDSASIRVIERPVTSCPVVQITSSLTASATVGQSFSYTITATTTGVTSTTTRFSILSSLPSGLSFGTSTATISGTPTASGTSTIVIRAENDCGSDTENLVITIAPAPVSPPPPAPTSCPVPTINSSLTASATVNNAFSYVITATTTGVTSTTTNFTVLSGLPNSLSFSTSTATISGTPTDTGTFNIVIRATTDCGSDTDTLVLTVNPAPSGGGGGGGGGGSSRPGDRSRAPVTPGEVAAPVVTAANFCPYLTDFMRIGMANDPIQVIRLQAFLKVFEKFDYVTVNGVFDQATHQAVMEFQLRYKSEILAPWGISQPTGYVYKLTLAKINQILCGSPMPQVTPAKVIKDIKPACPKAGCPVRSKEGVYKEGMGTSTVSSLPLIGNTVSSSQGQNTDNGPDPYPESIAAALFSWPDTPAEAMKCLFELLIILIVLYVLGNVLESVLYKDVPENASKRFRAKWLTIIIGLALALGGAYLLQEWCLLLPLIVALIASIIWFSSRHKHESLRARATQLIKKDIPAGTTIIIPEKK